MADLPRGVRDAMVELVTRDGRPATVSIAGRSMRPLLHAGMVADVVPLARAATLGEIIVYRTRTGLVAHRVIARRGDSYLTSGDAEPENVDEIAFGDVLGRLANVRLHGGSGARRIDGRRFALAGRWMQRSHALRVLAGRARAWLGLVARKPDPKASFRTLLGAVAAFECGALAEGVRRLAGVPPERLFESVVQHGMNGYLLRWLEAAAAGGIAVPEALLETSRRARYGTALLMAAQRAVALDALAALERGGVETIALKGAARQLRGEADADAHFASDVDLLVPRYRADAAVRALEAAGYRFRHAPREIRTFARRMHQRAPLWPPSGAIPVEVHVALCVPGSASVRLDYASLVASSVTLEAGGLRVRVLDEVGDAVHAAYHGRNLRRLRDVVALSRSLRRMAPAERARFDALTRPERRDPTRLQSTIALAEALGNPRPRLAPHVARYVAWSAVREDLPLAIRKRASLLETAYARAFSPSDNLDSALHVALRALYSVLATPVVVRWARASARRFGNPVELLVIREGAVAPAAVDCGAEGDVRER